MGEYYVLDYCLLMIDIDPDRGHPVLSGSMLVGMGIVMVDSWR